ncbi:MAG: DUF2868 domain-containing protein [Natronospirillum sp.]
MRPIPIRAWLLSVLLGAVIVFGSLSYQPDGRINILWVWVVWALLPALGSVLALGLALWGGRQPWLFRWGQQVHAWYPTRRTRWQMLWQVQWWWCTVAISMVLTYSIFLLFTDLAFGWSSTLITEPAPVTRLVNVLAWPWHTFWPTAAPSAEIVTATQFMRIDPMTGNTGMAVAWWPFLLASLLVYNLLPRALLAAVFYWRWRTLVQPSVSVVAPGVGVRSTSVEPPAQTDTLTHWNVVPKVAWEFAPPEANLSLGSGSWLADQQALDDLLTTRPSRLCWWVVAERAPVAELADCMALARTQGVQTQGLYVQCSASTDAQRHLASWDAFARQHGLIWLT